MIPPCKDLQSIFSFVFPVIPGGYHEGKTEKKCKDVLENGMPVCASRHFVF
jgi:hypothetical protein